MSSEAPSQTGDVRMSDVGGEAGPPQKKKQKRNKPTLSCIECVERKTKVGSRYDAIQ